MASVGRKSGVVTGMLTVVAPSAGPPEYYAFARSTSPDGIIPCLYDAAGTYLGDLSAPLSVIVEPDYNFILIRTDAGGFVGDGSIAGLDSGIGDVTVYDAVNATSFSFTISSPGWDLGPHLGFSGGWLYWAEIKVSGVPFVFDLRLRKCRCDGSGSATVATMNATFYDLVNGMVMQPDGALIFLGWTGGIANRATALISFAGSSSGPDTFTGNKNPAVPGVAISGNKGISVFPGPHFSGPLFGYRLGSCTNASATTFAGLWPDVGWGNGFQMSVNAAGTEASLYDGTTLIRNSLTAIGASPTTAIVPANHPSTLAPPSALFIGS